MKGIDLLGEVVPSLDRWAVVPNGMKTRFDIGQLHSCGLLVGSSMMAAGFIHRGKTSFGARPPWCEELEFRTKWMRQIRCGQLPDECPLLWLASSIRSART